MTPADLVGEARRVVQRVLVAQRAGDGGEDMAGIVWAAMRVAWRQGVLAGARTENDADVNALLSDDFTTPAPAREPRTAAAPATPDPAPPTIPSLPEPDGGQ